MHPGGFSAEDTQDVQYTNQNIIINNNTSTNHNNIFIQNPLLTKKEIPKIEYMKPEAIAVVKNINNLKSAKKSSPVIISEKESMIIFSQLFNFISYKTISFKVLFIMFINFAR